MSIEWKTYRLGDVIDKVIDNRGKSAPTSDVKYSPIIEINSIGDRNPNYDVVRKWVSKDTYDTWFRSGHPIIGDILIPTVGTIGIVSMMRANKGCIAQNIVALRTNEKAHNLYLYYFLRSEYVKQELLNLNIGGVQPSIKVPHLLNLEISLPGLEEQRRIAGILGAIDDKIENNRRINTNLELQAQALYKQWFVDFEFPNEEGKPYKSSGGKMVDSELGPIPEGWSVKRLDDYTVIKRGGSPRPIQNYLSNTGLNWLKISDATSTNSPFILEIKEFIKEEGLSKTVFLKKGNLVLSNSATPCIPKFLGLDTCIHDGWLYFPNAKLSKEYLYLLFKNNRQEILSQGNGSVFLNLKTDILKSHLICLPNCIEKMNCFNMIVKAIFKNIENCSFEIERLATLRDTLLPKLMNGEIITK